jgi:hypothetical protein
MRMKSDKERRCKHFPAGNFHGPTLLRIEKEFPPAKLVSELRESGVVVFDDALVHDAPHRHATAKLAWLLRRTERVAS